MEHKISNQPKSVSFCQRENYFSLICPQALLIFLLSDVSRWANLSIDKKG